MDPRRPDDDGRAHVRRYGAAPFAQLDPPAIFSHEAYHCGELSQTLGIAGLPQIDLWRPNVAGEAD